VRNLFHRCRHVPVRVGNFSSETSYHKLYFTYGRVRSINFKLFCFRFSSKIHLSVATLYRHIFQACPVWIYTQSNITNIIFTWVHNTNTEKKSYFANLSQATSHLGQVNSQIILSACDQVKSKVILHISFYHARNELGSHPWAMTMIY
jgi:hypothetical protein